MGKHRLEDRELKESARQVVPTTTQTTTRRNPTSYFSVEYPVRQDRTEQAATPEYTPQYPPRRPAQQHVPQRQQVARHTYQPRPPQAVPYQQPSQQQVNHQPVSHQPSAPLQMNQKAQPKPASRPAPTPAAKSATAPGRKRRSHALPSMRRKKDDLYERSFKACLRCGEDVYVLASSCRNCDG